LNHYSDDAAAALAAVGPFLEADPVMHNVVLTVLQQRVDVPAPGHYWWVTDGTDVAGFLMQTPRTFKAAIVPCDRWVVAALVDAVDADLPGVQGEVATAAAFAGEWTERHDTAAAPDEGQRVYVLTELPAPPRVDGSSRLASSADVDALARWIEGFCDDVGQPAPPDLPGWTAAHVARGGMYVWERDGVPVSTAIASPPVGGVARIGYVYTPPDQRGHGYGAAITAAASAGALATGADRCMLYTQLSNPVSNRIYRRLGYRAVAEVLSYRFG
jgi:predicted GNAT family acetyltransferase